MRTMILSAVLLLAACAAKTPKVAEAPSGVGVEVVTLDQGAEPRDTLRYHWSAGRSERLLLRLSLASFIHTRIGSGAVATPVLDLVLDVGASYQAPEKHVWGYPVKFEMIGVTGAEALSEEEQAALAAELAPITQTQGIFEIDDRGITQNAEISIPEGASPRLLSLLGNVRVTLLSAALPEQPVGVGARWEVERLVKVGAMQVPQKVTYTLLEREEDVLRIGVVVRQSAAPQVFAMGLDGTTFDLEAYEVSAVGTTIVDLHGFAPLSELHGLSQMRATLRHRNEVEPVAMSSDVTIQVSPLPEDTTVPAPESEAPQEAPAEAAPSPSGV